MGSLMLNWIALALSMAALGVSGWAYWLTQGTWLKLAQTSRLQAETWQMLDRYDLAKQCLADADRFEAQVWMRKVPA